MDVQAAIAAAAPGDTILFADGFYERPLTIDRPLNLQAVNPGKATFLGVYDPGFGFTADARAPGLYATAVPWKVSWVMVKNRVLLDYQSLDHLIQLTFPETGTPGPQEGFYYNQTEQKLYLRLPVQANPNLLRPRINRDDAGMALYINANQVSVAGFRFHGWSRQAIQIEANHNQITLRDNVFEGNATGVLTAGYTPEHRDILIEHNEFSTYPVYQIRRAGGYEIWQGLYHTNLNTRGIHAYTNGITIRNNYLYELFDGIQVLGWKGSTAPTGLVSDISANVIQNIVDNPLEFDAVNAYLDARAHHNFVFDAHALVSMTSFQYGRLMVDHNIFYSSPEFGLETSWFKTKLNAEADPSLPEANLTLAHNTVVLQASSRLYIPGSEQAAYQNCKLQNNIVQVREISDGGQYELTGGEGFIFYDQNILDGPDVPAEVLPGAIHRAPGFAATAPRIDFHLQAGGAAVGAGENHDGEYFHTTLDGATDLGAIEYGSRWAMERPGPTWGDAQSLPNRPALPPSLDPAFLGIESPPAVGGALSGDYNFVFPFEARP